MSNITALTRKEALAKLETKNKYKLIYEQLGDKEYTARELATKMYNAFDDDGKRLLKTQARQEVAPRLTELEQMGLVEAVRKKYDEESGCKVAVYRKKNN